MSTTYRYYLAVDKVEGYSRERPFAVIRREMFEDGSGGGNDHGFGRAGEWVRTSLMLEWEHGDPEFDFIEVDEAEANRVVEYLKAAGRADSHDQQNESPQ